MPAAILTVMLTKLVCVHPKGKFHILTKSVLQIFIFPVSFIYCDTESPYSGKDRCSLSLLVAFQEAHLSGDVQLCHQGCKHTTLIPDVSISIAWIMSWKCLRVH